MPTDTSEGGLEDLIVAALTGQSAARGAGVTAVAEAPAPYGGAGYVQGDPRDYDREHAADLAKLLDFLRATQPKVVEAAPAAAAGKKKAEGGEAKAAPKAEKPAKPAGKKPE